MANAKDWAKPFRARLLEPGIVSYEDSGNGKVLLRKETIDRDIHTFVGRPLVVKQNRRGKLVHRIATPDNMKEIGHGYVTEVYFNPSDGWWWAKGLADTDEAVEAIERVGKCSCAYGVTRIGPPNPDGWHDIPYNEEILGFSGEHLAIVDNPRYEDATILLNSKNPTGRSTMSFITMLKKIASPAKPADDTAATQAAAAKAASEKAEADRLENAKKSGAESISADTTFTIPGEKEGETETVDLSTLLASHRLIQNAKMNGIDMADGDEFCYNGKKYRLNNAMVEAFDKWQKVNATEDKKEEEKKENAKADQPETAEQISAREDAARRAENSKRPVDHFNVLVDARLRTPPEGPKAPLGTLAERLENGRRQFGSKAKAA